MNPNICFIGTPSFVIETADAVRKKYDISFVITGKSKYRKRGRIARTPVCIWAEKNKIPILMIENPQSEKNKIVSYFKKYNIDISLVFAFGRIFPKWFLDLANIISINIHPSLLPDLRGPSPIRTAILRGYKKSGITIQKIAEKIDAGDILFQREFELPLCSGYTEILQLVSTLSAKIINPVIDDIVETRIKPIKQDDKNISYCSIFNKSDAMIDWYKENVEILNQIRAFDDTGAFSFYKGVEIKILKAEIETNEIESFENPGEIRAYKKYILIKCGKGFIKPLIVKKAGKKETDIQSFLNGIRIVSGDFFTAKS